MEYAIKIKQTEEKGDGKIKFLKVGWLLKPSPYHPYFYKHHITFSQFKLRLSKRKTENMEAGSITSTSNISRVFTYLKGTMKYSIYVTFIQSKKYCAALCVKHHGRHQHNGKMEA